METMIGKKLIKKKKDCEGFVNRIQEACELITVLFLEPCCWDLVGCIINWMLAESSMASLFPTCGPGLPKENQVEALLYFKSELRLLGPICSWSHSENIALCFAGTESGPFASMWPGSDESEAKNGTLSLWVTSHPTSFPLSFFPLVLSHTSHPKLT